MSKQSVSNSKSVSHLSKHELVVTDSSVFGHKTAPMSSQIERRKLRNEAGCVHSVKLKKKLNKKIITTSHYDLKDSSSETSEAEATTDSKTESLENYEDTGNISNENENCSDEVELISANIDKSREQREGLCRENGHHKDEMKYGFIATSAPAILDIQQAFASSENEPHLDGHMFYASASQLKLNTRDLYNQIYGSHSNNESGSIKQAVSTSELKSSQYNQTIEVIFVCCVWIFRDCSFEILYKFGRNGLGHSF